MIMKKNIKFNSILVFSVMACLMFSGCKKGWLDVNYNPRQLTGTTATPDVLLAPVILHTSFNLETQAATLSLWMGYWAPPRLQNGLPYTTYKDVRFQGAVRDEVAFLEQKSLELKQDFYQGIAKTLKAYAFAECVDLVNNMPYFETFKVDIYRPKYDNGQVIYDDLMLQLNLASGLIKNADPAANPNMNNADIMFKGDKIKWLQFINTLKLRLLIHQANRSDRAAYIAREVAVITNEGSGFLNIDASFNPGFETGKGVSKYWATYSAKATDFGGWSDLATGAGGVVFGHANVYALNRLKADNDPRIGAIYAKIDFPLPPGASVPFTQPGPAEYRGSELGLFTDAFRFPFEEAVYKSAVGGVSSNVPVSTSSIGILKGNTMSDWLMTSIESKFLQAEAVYRGWIPGDKKQAYLDAVKESFRWLNVGGNSQIPVLSDNIFNSWYAQQVSVKNPNVSWEDAPDKYKLIMYQKYVGLNGIQSEESYTDYRRNGRYPDVPLSSDPARAGNVVPIRLLYPLKEYDTNAENVKAQGTVNVFTDKIWWMP